MRLVRSRGKYQIMSITLSLTPVLRSRAHPGDGCPHQKASPSLYRPCGGEEPSSPIFSLTFPTRAQHIFIVVAKCKPPSTSRDIPIFQSSIKRPNNHLPCVAMFLLFYCRLGDVPSSLWRFIMTCLFFCFLDLADYRCRACEVHKDAVSILALMTPKL